MRPEAGGRGGEGIFDPARYPPNNLLAEIRTIQLFVTVRAIDFLVA
jgi:hypothetical protein